MKKLYFTLTLLFTLNMSYAELAPGTPAPDWTLADIDGNIHHLYDYLNQGKHVLLDFSATWCGPCWNYHNSGVMETLWEEYGPDGTDEIMIFMIEAHPATNLACLYGPQGCNNTTYGDWTDVPYPIINLEGDDLSYTTAYNITYWPTIYAVNANDYGTYEVGQPNVGGWEEIFFESFAMAAAPTTDPGSCSLDGSVFSNVTGGAGSLNYIWSNNSSNTNLINVPSDIYGLTVTDANGIFVTAEIELLNGDTDIEITAEFIENINCYDDNNGSIAVDVASNSTLLYNWSNGESTATISNLEPGIYDLTITNTSNDCEIYDAFLIFEPDELEVDLSSEDALCGEDNGIIDVYVNGGVEPYSIYVNGNQIGGVTAPALPAGPYDIEVVDDNGCVFSSFITVEAQDSPEAVASSGNNSINCQQTTVLLESVGSSTGANIIYNWYNNANVLLGIESTVEVSEAGAYTLEVIDSNTGCISVAEVSVEADTDIPVIAVVSEGFLTCDVTTIVLSSEGSATGAEISYEWTNTAGDVIGNEEELVVTAPGAYTLVVVNSVTGCSAELTQSVEEQTETPEVPLDVASILNCNTTSLLLEAGISEDESYSYAWGYMDEDGNIVIADENLEVNEAGSYIAVITHASNGCVSMQDIDIVSDMEAPMINIPDPLYILDCSDDNIQIEVDIAMTNNISWSTDDGNIVGGGDTEIVSVDMPGTYQLIVTNPENGCTTEETIDVALEDNEPVSVFNFDVVGMTVVLQNISEGSDNTYTWDFGNGETSTAENPDVELGEGTYEICLTVTNDCGSDMTCAAVSIGGPLQSTGTVGEILCFGEATGSINLSISGGAPSYIISWEGPDGFNSSEEDLTGLSAGTYIVTISDAEENIISEEYNISEPTEIVISEETIVDDEAAQSNGSIDVSIAGGTGAYTYLWSNGAMTEDISGLEAGDYSLEVTDENDCVSTFMFTVDNLISSLHEIANISLVEVYPQPAAETLTINLELHEISDLQIELINISGVILQKHRISGQKITKNLSLVDVESGYYILRILEKDKAYTQGVIVVK